MAESGPTQPAIPTRDEFIAELRETAESFKGVPFAPEDYIDGLVEQQVALYDVVVRGLEAMAVDEAEAIRDEGASDG